MIKIAFVGICMALGLVLVAGGNDLGFFFFIPILFNAFDDSDNGGPKPTV
jgi:hypothetical protein